jgi:phosphatidylserine decarboxylase
VVFEVKGVRYSAAELLGGDSRWWQRFRGGWYLIFYLSPKDYHRMHSPVGGDVAAYRWIPGDFWPVNDLAARLPNVYCDNERVVTYLQSRGGLIAMVKVAAFGVGHISLAYLGELAGDRRVLAQRRLEREYNGTDAPVLRCGEEMAAFGLGSTVVLLVEPDRVELEDLRIGGPVRVGQRVGRLVEKGVSR